MRGAERAPFATRGFRHGLPAAKVSESVARPSAHLRRVEGVVVAENPQPADVDPEAESAPQPHIDPTAKREGESETEVFDRDRDEEAGAFLARTSPA